MRGMVILRASLKLANQALQRHGVYITTRLVCEAHERGRKGYSADNELSPAERARVESEAADVTAERLAFAMMKHREMRG